MASRSRSRRADDGILSTASLVVGVAAAGSPRHQVLVAGVAGLMGGALSMAAGEYVSVSSQADTEKVDLAIETTELATQPATEKEELADIYVHRGLDPELARTVGSQLMTHGALATHARGELGITEEMAARPLQAAAASGATFTMGAAFPRFVVILAPLGPSFANNFRNVARLAGRPGCNRCPHRGHRRGSAVDASRSGVPSRWQLLQVSVRSSGLICPSQCCCSPVAALKPVIDEHCNGSGLAAIDVGKPNTTSATE